MAPVLVLLLLAFSAHQEPSAVETTAPSDADEARGTINGVLTHAVSKERLGQAPVVLRASDGVVRHATTNDDGFFAFRELPADRYTLEVSVGKASLAKIFELEHEGRMRANFQIDPTHEYRRVVTVHSTSASKRELSPREQRRRARRDARDRRIHARFHRVLMRAERQKERRAEAAARKRARRES